MSDTPAPNGSGAGDETQVSTAETQIAPAAAAETLRYGDFLVVERLGAGAMGIVYKARQLVNERPTRIVALKVLKPELSNQPDFEERFFREAEHALNLDHPNVVQGIHAKKEGGVCFMAMEYIAGETLTELVTREGPLSVGDALKITLDVARGLKHAHDGGVFHRDIKPGNVMVAKDGAIKVTDLGLAKAPATDSEITHHGQLVGTPVYMAPEQSDAADEPDARFDVYALGGTLFYLLTGQSPFSGSTVEEILRQKRRPPSVRAVRNDAPAAVDTLLQRMLASDPAARFQSMRDVIDAIRSTGLAGDHLSWIEGEDGPGPRVRSAGFLAQHGVKVGAAAVLIALLAAAAAWMRPDPPRPTPTPVPTVVVPTPSVPTPPPGTPADVIIGRALSLAAAGELERAREALRKGKEVHPGDARLGDLAAEANGGVLPLLQYKSDDGTVNPPVHLPAADGVVFPSGTEFRIGLALARDCYIYLFDRDSVPTVAMLFPNARMSALKNPVPAGFHWIPDRDEHDDADQWMRVDQARGEDHIFLVAVTSPLRDEAKVKATIRDDPDELRRALAHDPGSLLKPGGSAASCFVASEWSSFSFQHK